MTTQSQISDSQVLALLLQSPARIEFAVANMTSAQLNERRQTEDWSIADILAHIRASDDILSNRLYAVRVRDEPVLPAFDERQWAGVSGYVLADFRTSLTVYRLRRSELVGMLRSMSAEDWLRTGIHESRGRMSALEIAHTLAAHEDEHCTQIEAIAGFPPLAERSFS